MSDFESSSSSQYAFPDPTIDPSSTFPTSFPDSSLTPLDSYPPSSSWSEMTESSTVTDPAPSISALSWGPSSSSTLIVMFSSTSLSGPIETQVSHPDSTSQSPKSTTVKLKTAHIVGMSFGAFVCLLAIGTLLVYLFIRLGRRRPNHQRFYSDPDKKHDEEFATETPLNNRGNDFGARGRGDLGTSRRILDRSYYDTRRSLSDGAASSITPLLQPSSSQSDNRGSEQEASFLGLGLSDVHASPISQSRSGGSFDEEFSGPSSPSGPPRYSRILPLPPILHPPRPLPMPTNPRPLQPQRRSNSIQVRMQAKPPLITSSTISLPLSSSPPLNSSSSPSSSFASGLSPPSSSSAPSSPPSFTAHRNPDPFGSPILEKLPPLLPQRRKEESIKLPPSSWSLSSTNVSPVTPFRPTPSVSFDSHLSDSKPKEFMKLKILRKQQHARSRSGPLLLTSESFRCAGEKAMNDEDRDFFTHEGVFAESPPSIYSQSSAIKQGTLIDA